MKTFSFATGDGGDNAIPKSPTFTKKVAFLFVAYARKFVFLPIKNPQ